MANQTLRISPVGHWPRRLLYPLYGIGLAVLVLACGLALDLAARAGANWLGLPKLIAMVRYGYIAATALGGALFIGGWLGRTEDGLLRSAYTDPLTSLANRRSLDEALRGEIERCQRYKSPMSVILVDVDWLKQINDTGGHAAGDRAIVEVARAVSEACRSTDLAARYGGDEFAVVLPATAADEAIHLASRIMELVAEARERNCCKLSVSIGVVDLNRVPAVTPEAMLRAADGALYLAKQHGRGQLAVAPFERRPAPASFRRRTRNQEGKEACSK